MDAAQCTALGRRGEPGQDAVARVLHEHPVVAGQQPLDVEVELVEHAAPCAVAGGGGAHGRVDDVDEQHGGQEARRSRGSPALPGDELLDLVDDGVELAGPRQQVGPGKRHEAGTGDVLGQVAAVLDQVGVAVASAT